MDSAELTNLRREHGWLLVPLELAVASVTDSPFFTWLNGLATPADFGPAGLQIFHHSSTLPKVIGMILAATPVTRGILYQPYAQHAHEEADHHLLLLDWLCTHGVVSNANEVYSSVATIETNNCINLAYELAAQADHNAWLACINTSIELCFFKFFSVAARRMHQIGAGHRYFDVHVAADAEHSVMGLKYLTSLTESEKRRLRRKSLDAVTLWHAMVHSWVRMPNRLQISDDGTIG